MLSAMEVSAAWSWNFDGLLALRQFNDDFWVDVHDHTALDIVLDFGRDDWPVNIALGYHTSEGTDCSVRFIFCGDDPEIVRSGRMKELSLGVRKIWRLDKVARPFLGTGISFVRAEMSSRGSRPGPEGRDRSSGVNLSGGVFWNSSAINFGFNVRRLTGSDLVIGGVSGDADSLEVGLLIGFGFPPG